MTKKNIKLMPEHSNVRIKQSTKDDTTIVFYNTPVWPGRDCIIIVQGIWEMQSTEDDILTLVNNDEIIPLGHEIQE